MTKMSRRVLCLAALFSPVFMTMLIAFVIIFWSPPEPLHTDVYESRSLFSPKSNPRGHQNNFAQQRSAANNNNQGLRGNAEAVAELAKREKLLKTNNEFDRSFNDSEVFLRQRKKLLKAVFLARQLSSETIFINVAAFRDRLCQDTVREIYTAALHPERVFIGIVDQRVRGDRTCLPEEYYRRLPPAQFQPSPTTTPPDRDPEYEATRTRFLSCYRHAFCPSDNVRVRYVDQTEARGPTFGRFMAGLMYQGESFYMMIDSHSRFYPHYDEYMLLDVLRMRESYTGETGNAGKGGVLSQYPSGFTRFDKGQNINTVIMAMCKVDYESKLFVLKNGARWVVPPKRPIRQPFTAAGFVFSESTPHLDVPFDPYLDFVFDGEEVLYTTRLFTHGYDSYLPGRPYILHNYERHKAKRFWHVPKTQWPRVQGFTRNRVHYLMETHKNQSATDFFCDLNCLKSLFLDISLDKYGMGTVRPIKDFYDYGRVDQIRWKADQETTCKYMERMAQLLAQQHQF